MRRILLFVLVAAMLDAPAHADDIGSGSLVLTAWTEHTGLPPGEILAMTQDVQGFLWLGTSAGLVRFDGARFVAWGSRGEPPLRARTVPALVAARDGSLWVGFGAGGISQIRGTDVIDHTGHTGVPQGAVAALLQDRQGAIWVGARQGFSRFRDGGWEAFDHAGEVFSLFEDRAGRIWIGTSVGVLVYADDALELRDPNALYVQNFAEDASGVIWVTDVKDIVKTLDGGWTPAHAPDVRAPQSGWRLVPDRHGAIWVAALGGGLLRLTGHDGAVIGRVAYEDMINGAPRSLFYDRDDNVWVGLRPAGLLRLSQSFVKSDVALEGVTNDGVRAIASSPDGSVWVGTGHSLHRFKDRTREVYDIAQTRALYTDAQGVAWAFTSHGVRFIDERRPPDAGLPSTIRWDRMMSVVSDPSGALWLCNADQGVMIWRQGVLSRLRDIPAAWAGSCSYAHVDRRGRVWLGLGGALVVYDGESFETYRTEHGLASGLVLAMLEDRTGAFWITTRNGVSRYRNGRFTTLTEVNGPFDDLAAALVEDQQGFIWVSVDAGSAIVRLDPAELDKVAADPARQIEYRLFDMSDGIRGELRSLIRAAGVRDAQGQLWFATGFGVVILDPSKIPPNQRSAPPQIESVSLDGRMIGLPEAGVTLPGRASTLTIEYTAVSVSAASKLRFRYRLEGVEPTWVLAGPRRTVSYADLAPGRYQFRVSATNDGVWSEAATWAFVVSPPFYRSSWFLVLSMGALGLMVGAAWWLRLSAVRRQYHLVFEERARMSREIHDTLLQSLAAIGVELENIATQLNPAEARGRESLRRLRRQVVHSLREARESILGLRQNSMESRSLVSALQALADNTTAAQPAHVDLTVDGRPRRCNPDVELQLLRISQEAVTNAIRHGAATHISLVIDFRPEAVALSVSDNGRGFVVGEHLTDTETGTHLGLLGMRERAERVRGTFAITSTVGKGALVEVSVPTPPE